LFLLLKNLLDTISATGKATIDAIAENARATEKSAENLPPEPLSRITVDVQIPREETDRYYAEQQTSQTLQRWTFCATVATFLAVVAYAVITYLQWRTMNATYAEIQKQTLAAIRSSDAAVTAANAASDQVTLLRQQLETQGAFVQIRIDTTTSPWEGRDFPYPTGIAVSVLDIGPTTALHVHVTVSVVARPIPRQGSRGRNRRNIDFVLQQIESVSPSLQLIPRNDRPPTRREFSINLSKEERMTVTAGKLSIVSQGTMSYITAFGRRIQEPVCYTYWSYWSRDSKGQGSRIGDNSTCSDFENMIEPRIPESIEEHIRQQQQQK